MTAQSIITKVNKSLYVTISTSLLSQKCPAADITPQQSLGKYIILSMYILADMPIISFCFSQIQQTGEFHSIRLRCILCHQNERQEW